MITFFVTLMAHCFGRRPPGEVIWIIAVLLGIFEIQASYFIILGMLK